VVLLDEVEKAHPDIFNILLQVLDDGRLTDSLGRTVDFRNTVIIMTSNLGSQCIQEMTGTASYAAIKAEVMQSVSQYFKPEFINRIDEIVMFEALTKEHIGKILDLQLAQVAARLKEHNIELCFSATAKAKLVAAGYDPVYGARPLKRVIRQAIENPLAQAILAGQFTSKDRINIDVLADQYHFTKTEKS
jgi:ATP-dependent Clp protease ATP-binding subunit ClpB